MSWLERGWLVQALRALLVYGWYLTRQRELSAAGALEGQQGLVLLGWEMLLLILVTVAAGLVVHILCVILSVATGQESASGLEDERDKLIEARAMVTGFTMTGLGFMAAVLALWQGWGAVWAINLMLLGMVAADVCVNLIKFVRYWRGD